MARAMTARSRARMPRARSARSGVAARRRDDIVLPRATPAGRTRGVAAGVAPTHVPYEIQRDNWAPRRIIRNWFTLGEVRSPPGAAARYYSRGWGRGGMHASTRARDHLGLIFIRHPRRQPQSRRRSDLGSRKPVPGFRPHFFLNRCSGLERQNCQTSRSLTVGVSVFVLAIALRAIRA